MLLIDRYSSGFSDIVLQNANRPNLAPENCFSTRSPGSRRREYFVFLFTSKQYNGAFITEFRQLGGSGFKVPALCLGTGTFGGKNESFSAWGVTEVEEATKLVDISLEAGLSMFDSADVYSNGSSEEILGKAIKGRRDQVIISTKATFRSGPGDNDVGSSRHHLIKASEASLRRLDTDYIDLYRMHGFDALSPVEENHRDHRCAQCGPAAPKFGSRGLEPRSCATR